MKQLNKTRNLVMTAALTAIIIIMAFVPFLGYIPLGFMNATIIHIPVIVGAIILGPKSGAFLGLVFGLTSLWKNTTMPNVTSFVFSPFIEVAGFGGNFWSLVICLVPRILIGVAAYYVYHFLCKSMKNSKNQSIPLILSGVAGSLTNTLLVMNFIFLFFGKQYAAATQKAAEGLYMVIIGVICMNGVPEAILAGILTVGIARILLRLKQQ